MRRVRGGAGPGRETPPKCIPVWAPGATDPHAHAWQGSERHATPEARVAGMPVADSLFPEPPAEVDGFILAHGREVDEPGVGITQDDSKLIDVGGQSLSLVERARRSHRRGGGAVRGNRVVVHLGRLVL